MFTFTLYLLCFNEEVNDSRRLRGLLRRAISCACLGKPVFAMKSPAPEANHIEIVRAVENSVLVNENRRAVNSGLVQRRCYNTLGRPYRGTSWHAQVQPRPPALVAGACALQHERYRRFGDSDIVEGAPLVSKVHCRVHRNQF